MNTRIYKKIAHLGCVLTVVLLLGYTCTTMFTPDQLILVANEHRILGAVLLSIIMVITTVFAPLTSLPLVPVIAPILGPFTTGVSAYVGWLIGSVISFWIGRRFGQPIVEKYVRMDTIRHYEKYLNSNVSFLYIAILRMVVPVDILSYVLGICTHVTFRLYVYATAVGIAWFSFAFAYLGESFFNGNYVLFACIGVASLVILTVSWLYVQRTLSNAHRDQ